MAHKLQIMMSNVNEEIQNDQNIKEKYILSGEVVASMKDEKPLDEENLNFQLSCSGNSYFLF